MPGGGGALLVPLPAEKRQELLSGNTISWLGLLGTELTLYPFEENSKKQSQTILLLENPMR